MTQRLESSFYTALGHHWDSAHGPRRLQFLEKALSLAESCGNLSLWAKALVNISEVERMMGDFHPSETRAQKAQRLAKLAGNLFEEARALCSKEGTKTVGHVGWTSGFPDRE
ncbi:hypothetical protein B0H14DRAFT_2588214 [Mycena olivaceomarginata]|nr:hypothetical protein B0H14DRAFT_2588214 [Mycena olivaceomarginata]